MLDALIGKIETGAGSVALAMDLAATAITVLSAKALEARTKYGKPIVRSRKVIACFGLPIKNNLTIRRDGGDGTGQRCRVLDGGLVAISVGAGVSAEMPTSRPGGRVASPAVLENIAASRARPTLSVSVVRAGLFDGWRTVFKNLSGERR